ncbi:acyl-CoA N-acyltransferase [Radiomyces spectabilis]|uniref:acyl-CoA N-acyltransferase n=1 Tax=Radiomyces spectabilis TaxID=64574 RepID=UPI0022200B91|nr:acyl-CoA N-acyltransferase [Radiomyces spectabilis]KAI8381139.1 acyl-CoA N-acyltransferase [Radiomyces spectabilis]
MTTRSRFPPDYTLGYCCYCNGIYDFDEDGKAQCLLKCFDCHRNVHAVCSELDDKSAEIAQTYDWQCNECKSCFVCHRKDEEDKIVFCSLCDRGCHTFCCDPPLQAIPDDDWHCSICSSMPSPSSIRSPIATDNIPANDKNEQDYTVFISLSDRSSAAHPTLHHTRATVVNPPPKPTMITRTRKRRAGSHDDHSDDSLINTKSSKKHTSSTPLSDSARTSHVATRRSSSESLPSTRRRRGRPPLDSTRSNKRSSSPLQVRLTVKNTNASNTADASTVHRTKRARRIENGRKKSIADEDFYETFGHTLTKAEANIKRGTPTHRDTQRFAEAKSIATPLTLEEDTSPAGSRSSSVTAESSVKQNWSAALEVPKISQIRFGHYLIDTWYVAPYPEEYSQQPRLYICEYCMKYMKSSYVAERHKIKCPIKHPPGDEIYRDGKISIFEVDGRKNKIYCQNLCLLAKMFLDHKTLYYDVEPFLFYIMTETDDEGCHFVGYFSKEKQSAMNYNVSCILTMPIYQRRGFGQYLIDFSYLLSKNENKTGSPERPLSDLGLLSYRSYWKNTLFKTLVHQVQNISIEELSVHTSMTPDDIISTLQANHMIRFDTDLDRYVLEIDCKVIREHLQKVEGRGYPTVDPAKLTWTPFVLSRDRLAMLLEHQRTIKDGEEAADVDIVSSDTSSDTSEA